MLYKIYSTTILLLHFYGLSQGQYLWNKKATFAGEYSWESVGFSIGNMGYIATGASHPGDFSNELWQYDTTNNNWIQKSSLPIGLQEAVGFSIGNKGYIGTGDTAGFEIRTNQFFEYDPIDDVWTPKANFGGTPRDHAFSFSLNGKGYIGGGDDDDSTRNDLWEYDPVEDNWTKKSNMPISGISGAIAFAMNNKAYVGVGLDSSGYSKIFFEYDPLNDTWARKANFGGTGRWEAVAFSIGNYGYVGTGLDPNDLNDFWEYDPVHDSWKRVNNFPGLGRYDAIGFVIGSSGYLGIGSEDNDFYKFTPDISMAIPELKNIPYHIKFSPNPFSYETILETDQQLTNAVLFIYNSYGQLVKQIVNIVGWKIKIRQDSLPNGIYFLRLIQNNELIATDKFEITD